MSEESDYKKIFDLLMTGRRKEAAPALLELFERTTQKELKLKIVDALMAALDPINEVLKLIKFASKGIELAKELNAPDFTAYLMARKAEFLMAQSSTLEYERSNLKLPPGWMEFSTEADKSRHELLSKKIVAIEAEIDNLLTEAFEIAEQIGDKKSLAYILMVQASIASSCYLRYKGKYILGGWRTKIWLILHRWGYEFSFLLGFKAYKELNYYVRSFTEDYLKAAKLLEEINDNPSWPYYDLAVHLMTAHKFRKALHYLNKAEPIAKERNDKLQLAKITAVRESIKKRNKDMPDYLKGETREEIVV
jgi:hypothetical protein